MRHIAFRRTQRAFALPTVILVSVVMLGVLIAILSGLSSSTSALTSQYYQQLAKEAAEAGIVYAQQCYQTQSSKSFPAGQWPNDGYYLTADTACSGVASPTTPPTNLVAYPNVSTASGGTNAKSWFVVSPSPYVAGTLSHSLQVTGYAAIVSTSGTLTKVYSHNASLQDSVQVTSIAGGNDTLCTIRNGLLYCWGKGDNGQIGNGGTVNQTIPYLVNNAGSSMAGYYVEYVTTGIYTTCAIAISSAHVGEDSTSGNSLFCWGANNYDQFGPNYTSVTNSTTPLLINTNGWLTNRYFIAASARNNTCVITRPLSAYSGSDPSSESEYCWGQNSVGQSGENSFNNAAPVTTDPKAIYGAPIRTGDSASTTLQYVTQINSVSGNIGCNITSSSPTAKTGNVYCWGSNYRGENGYGNDGGGSGGPRPQGVAGTNGSYRMSSASKILTNNSIVCALQLGKIYCWGDNAVGHTSSGWYVINSGTDSVSDGVGGSTWRTAQYVDSPSLVATVGPLSGTSSLGAVTDMAFADWAGCGVVGGSVYCWGDNYWGELGQGNELMANGNAYPTSYTPGTTPLPDGASDMVPANYPARVGGVLAGQTVISIAASNGGFCATTQAAQVYCWGDNIYGQMGNGTMSHSVDSPTQARIPGSLSY